MTPEQMRALADIGDRSETYEYDRIDDYIRESRSALRFAAEQLEAIRIWYASVGDMDPEFGRLEDILDA